MRSLGPCNRSNYLFLFLFHSTPPGLEFLYTSFVNIANPIDIGNGPRGDRLAIPIIGGNFTGPKLSGTILNLGADWGTIDPKTGLFSPDTRYNFLTHDGANIFVQSTGSTLPTGEINLRFVYETGSKAYYYLNNYITVGHLREVATSATGATLRIDTWHLSTDSPTTTFLNTTCT